MRTSLQVVSLAAGLVVCGGSLAAGAAGEPRELPGASGPVGPGGSLVAAGLELPRPPRLLSEAERDSRDGSMGRFRERVRGEWRALYDDRTGRLSLLAGSGIPLLSASERSAPPAFAEVEARVRGLLADSRDLHGLGDAELVLAPERSGSFEQGELWYVDFDRTAGAIPVLGSRAYVRINHGNVIQIGFDALFPVEPGPPALGAGAAFEVAARAAGDSLEDPGPGSQARLVYRPYFDEKGLRHVVPLAWELRFRGVSDPRPWLAYVDARSGELLELSDESRYVSGAVLGLVNERSVAGPQWKRPLPLALVEGATRWTTTDGNGNYQLNDSGPFRFRLAGRGAPTGLGGFSVRNHGGPSALVEYPGGATTINHTWDDTNSTSAERNAYHHLHVARSAASPVLPSPWYGTLVDANVNLPGSCNAYWDSQAASVNFLSAGTGCNNAAEVSDFVIHEWAHGLDQATGGGDRAGGEGAADIAAWLLTRSPLFAPGFLDAENPLQLGTLDDYTAIRDASKMISLSNIAERCPRPPGGCKGPFGYECHCEGLVLSGAAWDLLRLLENRYGTSLAYVLMSRLHYLALPAWTEYTQVADALLAVDDDDGNLMNGTPNGCLIDQAFRPHGILNVSVPCSRPLVQLALDSVQILDLKGDGDGYADPGETISLRPRLRNSGNTTSSGAQATLTTGASGVQIGNARTSYGSIGAGATAEPAGIDIEVTLSAVACGTLVPFRLALSEGGSTFEAEFTVPVGRTERVLYAQDFENGQAGWTGNTGNALTGAFEIGTPQLTASGGDVWQPGSCAEGTSCYYTGANRSWADVGSDDVDGGTAIAESPSIDLANARTPVLQFRYWFTSSQVAVQPADVFAVEVVSQGGSASRVFEESVSRSGWRFASVPLVGKVPLGVPIRLRFLVTDDAQVGNIVEGVIDDVRIVEIDCATVRHCAYTAIVLAGGETSLCAGERTALEARAQGCAGNVSYQWRRDGVDIAGATGERYDISLLAEGEHHFDVRVGCTANSECSVITPAVTVTVSGVRAEIADASPVDSCQSDPVTVDGSLSEVRSCPGGAIYEWILDKDTLPATGPYFSVPASLGAMDHLLAIRVICASNPRCAVTSPPVVLRVVGTEATISNGELETSCIGESFILDGSRSETENCHGPTLYRWYRDGELLPLETGPTLKGMGTAPEVHDYELEVSCGYLPSCSSRASARVYVFRRSADVAPNSLRGVRSGEQARLSWNSSRSGVWNVYWTEAAAELPSIRTGPARASVDVREILSPEPGPAGGAVYYQVYGSDCSGSSVP